MWFEEDWDAASREDTTQHLASHCIVLTIGLSCTNLPNSCSCPRLASIDQACNRRPSVRCTSWNARCQWFLIVDPIVESLLPLIPQILVCALISRTKNSTKSRSEDVISTKSAEHKFIQNHFHPNASFIQNQFHPKNDFCERTTANKSKNNTAYARFSGFNGPSCEASPAEGRRCFT